MKFHNFSKGFTLIELLVTVVIAGILMAIALPNFRDFLVSSRLSSDINNFVGLINYARSEAITRNQSIVICPKSAAPAITCANTQFWAENEIQVFVDINGNDERNASDILLKTLPILDATGLQTAFTRPDGAGKVIFGSLGFAQTAHSFDIHTVKSGDTAYEFKYGRTVCISKPGRVRIISYGSTCS